MVIDGWDHVYVFQFLSFLNCTTTQHSGVINLPSWLRFIPLTCGKHNNLLYFWPFGELLLCRTIMLIIFEVKRPAPFPSFYDLSKPETTSSIFLHGTNSDIEICTFLENEIVLLSVSLSIFCLWIILDNYMYIHIDGCSTGLLTHWSYHSPGELFVNIEHNTS